MTWEPALNAALAALVVWIVYAAFRRGRGDDPSQSARGRTAPSYTEQERIERDKAERLMREQDEREREGR